MPHFICVPFNRLSKNRLSFNQLSFKGFGDNRYSNASLGSPTYGTINGGARDEQNQLQTTLHKLASRVIDVSSLDCQMEQSDWNDRQRIYAQRVANIKNPLQLKSKIVASNCNFIIF